MNRSELENQIEMIQKSQVSMEEDLLTMGPSLSAASSLAIIIRLVNLQQELDSYRKMLDFLKFEEITKDLK